MKKIIFYMTLLLTSVQIWGQTVTINESSGWLESAFVKWAPVSGAGSYNVYYTGGGQTNKKIDPQLIRSYGSYYRADVPGLAAGSYTLTIKPVVSGAEGTGATTGNLTVLAQDRNGFAFDGGRVPGAYKADGTPKDGAVILYITQNTKNTISMNITGASSNPCIGLQNILYAIKKGQDTRPFIIRLIGNITDMSVMEGGDVVIENSNNASSYLTLEGIGNDAVANGWGVRLKSASNIEVSNIGFMNCDSTAGDNVGMQQDNDHVWVHNCDMFYGDAGSDADQIKGDGALDNKSSTYITLSYNHFWDSGKASLLGLSEGTTTGLYITYHHNWFDHSDSRHPRVRYYSAHIYNNYYDGNSKYGAGSTLGSSLFIEGNFFRNCKYPMLTSKQGTDIFYDSTGTFSGEAGGTIKAFNNTMSGQTRYVPYNATNYPVEFDAIETATRGEVISSSIKSKLGANAYNNFDTNAALYVKNLIIDQPAVAQTKVMQYSGRVSGGDLKWTFNNSVDDASSTVITALKSALTNYTSTLVSVQGENNPAGNQTLTSPANNNQTVTSGTAISSIVYTWGGDATDATVTGLPASGISFVKNTSSKTITISGTPTATVSYSISTTGSIGTPANRSGIITVTTAGSQTLTSTANNNQTVTNGNAISSIVYTWGGTATDAAVTGLPASGISFVKNTSSKTITISGTPTATISYSISTTGTSGSAATGSGTITVTTGSTPSGDEIHNFTTSGKVSSFYSITGNMNSTDGSVTYDGLTLTKRLKIESSTSISYTTTAASTLTLVFDSSFIGTVIVNGVSYTASAGIVTASLPAGSNTITKGSTANIFYISTKYNTTPPSIQTLTSTSNNNQTVASGTAISSIVYTWGGSATDAAVSGLPASGISFVKNSSAKTITISGTPTASVSYSINTSGTGTPVTGSGTITVTAIQTLTSTSNNNQTVASGTAIGSIVYTWGGDATDATVTGLPASGISFVKNSSAKTITISGNPTATVSYSISTSGSGASVTGSGVITVTVQTLTTPNNNNQTVASGTAISSIVYTWGGDATDASVTGLPALGITFVKNTVSKTITISGTPTATVSYSVITSGAGTSVNKSGTITVTTVATPSDQIHNFTTSGKVSSFYTITGNMNSTDGSVSYNGLTLTKRLKIESSTSINYTTTAPSTLTLVFDSNFTGTIIVNGVSRTAAAGIVTVSLPAGANTVTKGSVANLFYISTKYNTSSRMKQTEVVENETTKLVLYPNPVTNQLNISSDTKVENVMIYNLTGSLVKSLQGNVETIDMSDLSSGSYLVKVITEQRTTDKVIIKK